MIIINNYKDEKGITLIALIIMIIVLIILASVGTYTGISSAKNARYFSAIEQLKSMQTEVNLIYQKCEGDNTKMSRYGEEITSSTKTEENENVEILSNLTFDSLSIEEEKRNNYRYFSKEYIKNTLNIAGMTNDFLINMENRSVLLLKGIKKGDLTLYVLSQIDNSSYNVEFESDDENQEDENINNIEKKVNVCNPKVSGKEMIPVVWNEGILSWVKADVTWNDEDSQWEQDESELKWYDYSKNNKKWANIVTVEENGTFSREYYEQAQAGTEILMKDITCMYVWIPRFENKNTYYTDETYETISENETIYINSDVRFLGKNDIADSGYEISSAFSYKDNLENTINLEGFWIGKFEASNYTSSNSSSNIGENYGGADEGLNLDNAKYIKIKPNVTSWRNFSAETLATTIEKVNDDKKTIYGLEDTSEIGMVTADMWDVVATLAQSEYGNELNEENQEAYGNFYYLGDGTEDVCYYTTLAGIVAKKAGTDSNDYSGLEDGSIIHLVTNEKEENTGHIIINKEYNYYEYWTEIGNKGSTSSNVYGVFDMVGGAGEYNIDAQGNYYMRGGSFYDLIGDDAEKTNIFYKTSIIKTEAFKEYSFRTALVIK